MKVDIYTEAGLCEIQNWRYATQVFQKGVSVADETWNALEEALVLTPSAYGLQPWKFIVITDHNLKTALRPLGMNQAQIEDCSHLVVFCVFAVKLRLLLHLRLLSLKPTKHFYQR